MATAKYDSNISRCVSGKKGGEWRFRQKEQHVQIVL